jgi:hypothetical protein
VSNAGEHIHGREHKGDRNAQLVRAQNERAGLVAGNGEETFKDRAETELRQVGD